MELVKTIYSDFDGTITKKDAVNTFFEMYAPKKWLEYEKLWVEGKITSRENAIKQVALLKNISQQMLDDYINSIEIDEHFVEFYNFIKTQGTELIVLSDGFDLFIEKVLEKHNIIDVKIFANRLTYNNGSFEIKFPHFDDSCKIGAGMCKCGKIKEADYWYIGDGVSDLCVAKNSKHLFATKYLAKYCDERNIKHTKFNTFGDILAYIK